MNAADSIQLITLADNYVNGFLASTQTARRPRLDAITGEIPGRPMLAEFGWSLLARINVGGRSHSILFDTGLGKEALLRNASALKVDLKEVEALVVSHGHPDHTAATSETLSAIGREELPLILHPGALRKTMLMFPNGERSYAPYFLDERELRNRGARLEKSKGPTRLASETTLVTGEIPRHTDFERGMPPNMHFRIMDETPVHDPLILDDQGLVINLKDKGLVVISGCAHAGIINTVRYAQEVSGVDKVYAVVGGFHLTGDFFAPIIDKTVTEMKSITPKIVLPSHCTGIRALIKLANALPDAFIENSVGTIFQF
ncbi:MAG TPA: MBL fold metallo-hydrolase [Nitrososphaerales archaeon]|nr:MBL fold metallo-hydrolase [Nitrososphaerales archaeon]